MVSGVTSLSAAAIDALFALGLAFLVDEVVARNETRGLIAAVVLAVLVAGNWLLNVVGQRMNRRLTERASVYMESHVARLQSSIGTLEHQERVDYLDRISHLRNSPSTASRSARSLDSM